MPVILDEQALAAIAAALPERDQGREWFSVESAAAHLDCSPERIRKLIARREIPFYSEGVGCRITLRRSELDEWLSGFRHAARGGAA